MLGGHGDGPLLVSLCCTAFLCEGISWLLLYCTSTYKSFCSSIDKASTKLESMKSTSSSFAGGAVGALASSSKKPSSRAKKMDRVKTSLKESTRDLSLSKFKIEEATIVCPLLPVLSSLISTSQPPGNPREHRPFVLDKDTYVATIEKITERRRLPAPPPPPRRPRVLHQRS